MRSFTIFVLFALALAVASFAPVASADANITLYADVFCTQMMGDGPQNIPIPSSLSCQDMSSPTQSGSAVYYCFNTGGFNNFSLSAWMTASDCSGTPDITINSYGKTDTCAVMSITAGGQSIPAFAKLSCSDSGVVEADGQPLDMAAIVSTVNVAKRAAFIHKRAGRNPMMARLGHPNRMGMQMNP